MSSSTETIELVEILNESRNHVAGLSSNAQPTLTEGSTAALTGQHGPSLLIHNDAAATRTLPKGQSLLVTVQLAGINFVTSFTNGLVTVALPAMAAGLDIESGLLLWPMSAYALTSGSCLLLAGAVADVIGPRVVNLVGCLFIAIFTLASGFAQTGIQLIIFRAMQGIAGALALPTAMSIISRSVESGRRRNIAFACLGLAMPLGFSFGLVLGGVFVSGPGWRAGAYVGGGASFLLFVVGTWVLPPDEKTHAAGSIRKRLATEIDWIGAALASTSIVLLSYFLATISADASTIGSPTSVVLLVLSALLMPCFALWMNRQEKLSRPALIPNSLWNKAAFTSVCLMVLLCNAVVNSMELYSSLFFQEVQGLSALQASLRILPNMVLGVIINFATGIVVDKVPAVYAVMISSGLCAIAPLLMAFIDPRWPYWYDAFFAQLLTPMSVDVLFTIGILIVSDVFPTRTQALAGAVFNTVAQLGTSTGLCITSVVSAAVTKDTLFHNKSSPQALMEGYRATFWTLFAWMVSGCIIGGIGLRKLGKIGEKRD